MSSRILQAKDISSRVPSLMPPDDDDDDDDDTQYC